MQLDCELMFCDLGLTVRTGSDLKNPKRTGKMRQNTGEAEGKKKTRKSIRTGPSLTPNGAANRQDSKSERGPFFHPWINTIQLGAPCNRFLAWTHSLIAPRSSGKRPHTVAGCRPIRVSGDDTHSKKAFFPLTHRWQQKPDLSFLS